MSRATQPHLREAGAGPRVICLHANASASTQWRGLMDLLSADHHVLAPDAWGAGKSPEWPSDRVFTLRDELCLIDGLLDPALPPAVLVGHSYGAAVALIAAVERPAQVRALVLYEPTLFALIDALAPPPNDADGIRGAVAAASRALDIGDRDAAARAIIDYWMDEGSWARMPEARQPAIRDSIVNVRRWAHALTTEPTPLSAFAALDIPVLYMTGGRSTASAHGVARVLVPALRHVQEAAFEQLGHMGPVTHPEVVNAEIARFVKALGDSASMR